MFKRLINYFKNSKMELKKVVWPTKKEAFNYTWLVIGVSLGVALFLGILDFLFMHLLQLVIS